MNGSNWFLGRAKPGEGERDGFHDPEYWAGYDEPQVTCGFGWILADVPGDVHSTLLKHGLIPDPYYSSNYLQAQWIQDYEWWYRRKVIVPESWDRRNVDLVFDGLDFIADVWANGVHLGHHEGMFSTFSADVSGIVQNSRRILIAVRLAPAPTDRRRIGGRKCNVNYGIDYAPQLISTGIWRDVNLVASEGIRLGNVLVRTKLNGHAADAIDSACVSVDLTVEGGALPRESKLQARLSLKGATFAMEEICATAELKFAPDACNFTGRAELHIPAPKLWWTWDLGRPDLHWLKIELSNADRPDQPLDVWQARIGLREIQRVANDEAPEGADPWRFVLNGRKMFLRGANWTNVDLLPGLINRKRYDKLLNLAREANMNALRVHGWHLIETDAFYDRCDELGLLVWQEFPFCNTNYPQTEAFIRPAVDECLKAIRRVRHHASLAMLGGGNEFNYKANRTLLDELGRMCAEDLPDHLWTPVSGTTFHAGRIGDHHSWDVFWAKTAPIEDYGLDKNLFVSEFGLQAPPSARELAVFLKPEDLWPPGKGWEEHFAALRRLKPYASAYAFNNPDLAHHFRTIDEFVAASQQSQAYGLKYAIENFRRRKGKCGGCIFWQYNEPWPAIVWSIVSYHLVRKESYEAVKQAYAPLQLNLAFSRRWWKVGEDFTAGLWVVNDFHRPWSHCRAAVRIFSGSDQPFEWEQEIQIPADCAQELRKISWRVPEKINEFRADLELRDDCGLPLCANRYSFAVE